MPRPAEPGSAIAVSCGVLVLSPQRSLLLGHATGGRHWDIFKGLSDAAEVLLDTALRELREESGLAPPREALFDLGAFDYLPRKGLRLFAVEVEQAPVATFVCTSHFLDRTGRSRPEIDGYAWVPFDQVQRRCAKNMARVLTESLSLDAVADRMKRG
jgi:putative (di)nucleoside polyphosphate hydrolase